MHGVCVDVKRADGRPTAADLTKHGLSLVRQVALPMTKYERSYLRSIRTGGRALALVLARESLDLDGNIGAQVRRYVNALRPHFLVIGNEPDGTGESSWAMGQDEYTALVDAALAERAHWVVHPWTVGAGLVSGQPGWLDTYTGPILDFWDIHPYAKDAGKARQLLSLYDGYRGWYYRHSLLALEWWRPAEEIAAFARMLSAKTAADAFFSWHPVDPTLPAMSQTPEILEAFKQARAEG